MMYNNQFVCSVKSSGEVLKEYGDVVRIPFGSEFSIYLKNLNSRRASVKVSIDGEDVLNGSDLVIGANQSLDLERYLKDMNKGNKFKFIERTSNIEQHRGVGAEDGLIRVEFAFEKVYHTTTWLKSDNHWSNDGYNPTWYGDKLIGTSSLRSTKGLAQNSYLNAVASTQCNASVETYSAPVNDAGITVPGSMSNQKFTTVSSFATDPSTVIVLKLVGELGQNKVKQAVTVKQKPACQTCGTVNKAVNKFCRECGTALEVI